MDAVKNPDLKHFFLAAVTLSFVSPDGQPMDSNINVILNNDQHRVTKAMLEKAQVQAQVQLANSLGGLPDVKHVFILSMNYLGLMSETDFMVAYEPPKGTVQ